MPSIRTYFKLTKPGIVMGNLITCAGGFALASRGNYDLLLALFTILGLALIIASGCVCNNYLDRRSDAKMERTKNRPLVKGEITPYQALLFSAVLLLIGSGVLYFYVNRLALLLSFFGFAVYLVFYGYSKYHTVHATLIGSIAGAMPPVIGYCAVSNRLDFGAVILFLMIALWQMPHFYAIAVYRMKEYASASIPVFPLMRGMRTTKVHMVLYILGFMSVSFLLTFLDYVGYTYLIMIALLSLAWLFLCLKGFKAQSDAKWARKMFLYSLVVVMGVCVMIPFTVI